MPTKMIWLLPMWSNAGSRMFPRFFPHLTISLSQAVRDRTGHVAHAALRRRGFLRAANWKARAQVRWRNVKVSSTFSKVVGVRGRRPCGLSRLRQTQEGVRERAQWAVSQGEPSSGVPPWKCAKAHFQKGYHQSLLKPAPSARRPLAEAAAVFQSWVPLTRARCHPKRGTYVPHFLK